MIIVRFRFRFRFGGLVLLPGLVGFGGFDQQLQCFGGSGQNPDGAGSPGPDWGGVAAGGQDVGDPVEEVSLAPLSSGEG